MKNAGKVLLLWLFVCILSGGCGQGFRALARGQANVPVTQGWVLVSPGQTGAPAKTVRDESGIPILELQADRTSIKMLAAPAAPLGDFKTLQLKLWSQEQTLAAVAIEDRDRARFHAAIPLPAAQWTDVNLTAADFRLNDDSPVKKPTLEPGLATGPLVIFDAGKVLGYQGTNVLKLASMQINYTAEQDPDLDLPSVIDGITINVRRNGSVSKPVTIRNGGRLIIKAPSVRLAAGITLDGGRMEAHGCRLSIAARYPQQFEISANRGSKVIFNNCRISCQFMSGLHLPDSGLEMKNCIFPGAGFTCDGRHSTIVLADTLLPGEFNIEAGSQVSLTRCLGALLWLNLSPQTKMELELPAPDKKTDRYVVPPESQMKVSVVDCTRILWALLTAPGTDLTLKNSTVEAVGLIFPPVRQPLKICGLGRQIGTGTGCCLLPDRKLSMINSRTKTWNLYPISNESLEVSESTFGELMAFGTTRVNVRDSICTGAGGYIAADHKASANFSNCTFHCALVAKKEGQLNLSHCKVDGAITAADNSSITLTDTSVTGQQQKLGNGRILFR
jgi:hypothetical protein